MIRDISFSFVAEEIVRPGTDLEIRIKRQFDREVARAAVCLQQDGLNVATSIDVDEKNGTLNVSTKGLKPGQIREFAKSNDVGKVFFDDPKAVPDLVDSMAIARVPQAIALGFTGSNVRVAVFEEGPSDLSNLQFEDRYQSIPPASDHARLTSAIVKNNEPGKPHGYAPGCRLYSANSFNNDALRWALHRELPELAANGTGVAALGLSMSGTSFSAPAVAGTAALVQSANPTLKSWPEGCRAILLASADRNITGGTWVQDLATKVDQADGSGALNAFMAVSIAQQRRPRNSPATPRGWDIGSLTSADIGADQLARFRYHVHVPPQAQPGPIQFIHTVKVALAWNSKITLNAAGVATSSILTVDLDLIVRDSNGQQVAASASFDNSYEIVEFTGIAGRTYDIIIRRWSGTDLVWYGIAWNVTTRRFNVAPLVAGLE
ncbi:hypothetical protein EDB81DRAFT_676197 [Dactylonectria macrodidyma]|uniref:Peptidase S8/S53 domain-containing protein n=1 Tax=Dactylonectria macrodidyma TaxID=307937 RepID=A0A9P9FNV5_9HYPO|nr:hypothetical protein EDB81DRAFT_676197 [Dactylonectria macrodidyma]